LFVFHEDKVKKFPKNFGSSQKVSTFAFPFGKNGQLIENTERQKYKQVPYLTIRRASISFMELRVDGLSKAL